MGFWQLLFGETKAENHVSNVISVTSKVVASTVQKCTGIVDVSQVLSFGSGCTINNAIFIQRGKAVGSVSCLQTAIQDLSSDASLQTQVAQTAQAMSQGLGLSAAQTQNVIDQSLNLSNTIISEIAQTIATSGSVAQVVNCTNASLNNVYIDMGAEIGIDGSGVQNAETVVSAKTSLMNTVNQYSKAESKDIFALLANIGTIAVIALAVVASILGGAFLLTGGTLAKSTTSLLASPALWCGVCLVWLVVDGLLWSKDIWPYKKNVPVADGSVDKTVENDNTKTLLITGLPVVIVGLGIAAYMGYKLYSARGSGGSNRKNLVKIAGL